MPSTQTPFKQVADNANSYTTTSLSSIGVSSITLSPSTGIKFPQPGNGFILTLWDSYTYPTNPASDPNMEMVTCTARSGDRLTITPTTKPHASPCDVGLLNVASNTTDLQVAVNAAEANIATITSTAGAITAETARAQTAEGVLTTNLTAETTARASAITTEASARTAADTTLQTNLTNEATARATAVTTLQTNITAETAARTAADTSLQSQVTAIVNSEGANSGIATLDSSGKLVGSQLPALALTDTYVVASQAAMLALSAHIGDVAVRTDVSKTFILTASPATILNNWQQIITPGSTYTNATPTTIAVGGIPTGSTFSGQLITSVFDALFYPYQPPAFTGFSMSGQASPVEVGTAIFGSKTFTWSSSNSANAVANSVAIAGPNSLNSTGNPVSGSVTLAVGTNQLSVPGSATWTITGQNTNTSPYTSSFSVSWLWKVLYGTSTNTTLTGANVYALTSQLASSGTSTYSFGTGGYKYVAFPTSFPAAASFTDTSTNLDVTMADSTDDPSYSGTANGYSYATVSVTNSQSITTNYYVYRTKYVLGGSINIRVA